MPHDHEDVEVTALLTADAPAALAVLLDDEVARGVPVVDEGERVRLQRVASGQPSAAGWQAFVARRARAIVGYAGVVTDTSGTTAVGDAAVVSDVADRPTVLRALLTRLAEVSRPREGDGLQVWVRQVGDDDVAAATVAGFGAARRLGVLGRELADLEAAAPPPGVTMRAATPQDAGDVVAVLAAAYAGTDDGGWDLQRFQERVELPWFRWEDLLVAVDADGTMLGLHWLKRRDATTGEVYNLAVAPAAQGRRIGPVLLNAGLAHLREVGCLDVVLWVDRANERAVRLYTAHGFTTRWDDVAFGWSGARDRTAGATSATSRSQPSSGPR